MFGAHVWPMALPGCTTCEAKDTFSALRRIKNDLQSTMTERRLKSCCLLNIHSTVTDDRRT